VAIQFCVCASTIETLIDEVPISIPNKSIPKIYELLKYNGFLKA